jgi:DNA mismatch repair ATPase MutS
MILTGSNTGGKSTVLKGIAFNGLLAQTLGIVAADKAVVTPFSFLGISLNIVDNIAGGKSLFQSEIDRAVGLVNAAALFTGKGHCLLVVDELFRGTTPDRAQEQTYEFAQRFASFKNTIYILATHFVDKVTQLEVSTGGECKNYKIEIKRDADGALQRTFKLVEGINTSNVAADILDTAWKK